MKKKKKLFPLLHHHMVLVEVGSQDDCSFNYLADGKQSDNVNV